MQVTKQSDREIVLSRSFSAPRQAVFDALTQKNHLVQWMKPTNFSLVSCDVDLRAGGSFRHVYQRPSGKTIEVRGAYKLSFAQYPACCTAPIRCDGDT